MKKSNRDSNWKSNKYRYSCYYFNEILMHAIKALNFACRTDNVN